MPALAIPPTPMTVRLMAPLRRYRLAIMVFVLLALGTASLLRAQIEGNDRGVPPIDSSGSFEVTNVTVDVASKSSDAARQEGWREAQRRAWSALWAKMVGGAAPKLSDSALDGIVSAVSVEEEFIGPHRYIARLGVLFDRARAGQLLGITGNIARSAPMLVIPVQWIGSTPQSFETRTEWQKAWARFRAGNSAIDYVRPTGTGADPLLLNVMQTGRPGRSWWRMLLDQYGAADVIVPEVRLNWRYPGGPVVGHFSVRHGPDGISLASFVLRVNTDAALPKLLDEGVRRIDLALVQAMADHRLQPDPSLVIEPEATEEELATLPIEEVPDQLQLDAQSATSQNFTLQVDTPDSGAIATAEAQLRSIAGVRNLTVGSLAIGGTSVYRIGYEGNLDTLRSALAARGWQIESTGNGLLIRKARGGGQ